jgi:hypothetical protein
MKNISRKQAIRQGLLLTTAAILGNSIRSYGGAQSPPQVPTAGDTTQASRSAESPDASTASRASWMAGKWGMMMHWIAPGPGSEKGKRIIDLDQAVNQFDLPAFIEQFQQTGADYLIFTVGQNTTYYASPNAVMDKYAGPGHCSQRDLVLELAIALKKINKRFIAYLPAEIKGATALHEAFKWDPRDQHEFEKRYTEFIEAYALQWGKYVDGWWFDGCYTYEDYYVPRSWQHWGDVSRAGNKHAVIAFNNGSFYSGFTQPLTFLQDYLSGECAGIRNGRIALTDKTDPDRSIPASRYAPGTTCQFHVLTPIDNNGNWINEKDGPMPPPKYSDAELFPFVSDCVEAGAAVTLNVGVYQDGRISQETLKQLNRMAGYLAANPADQLPHNTEEAPALHSGI